MFTLSDMDASNYSDLHKDVYGHRPRGYSNMFASQEEFDSEYAYLLKCLEEVMERETQQQQKNCATFEAVVANVQSLVQGATRQDAVRYMMQQLDCEMYGYDYVDFEYGLPYGYTKKFVEEV